MSHSCPKSATLYGAPHRHKRREAHLSHALHRLRPEGSIECVKPELKEVHPVLPSCLSLHAKAIKIFCS